MDQIIQICRIFTLFFFIIFSSNLSVSKEKKISLYGNYLSWNFARSSGDIGRLKDFFSHIRVNEIDFDTLEEIFFESVILNDWLQAKGISNQILQNDKTNFSANLLFLSENYQKQEFSESTKFINRINLDQFDINFVKALLLWSSYPKKDTIQGLDKVEDCIPLICLHLGLYNMFDKEREKAKPFFKKLKDNKYSSYRVKELLLHNFLELGDFKSAREIFDELRSSNLNFASYDIEFFNRNKNFLNPVISQRDALAEVYYNISSWYFSKDLLKYSAFFGELSLRIRPEFNAMKLLLLGSYDKLGYNKLAMKILNNVDLQNIYFFNFLKIKTSFLERVNKLETGINNLKAISAEYPKNYKIKILLADKLRSNKEFKKSIDLYTEIVNTGLFKNSWSLYYSRGIAYEQSGHWVEAEKDLQQAMKLNPDDPYVLNYLAYSWLDRKINVKQALELLEKAVEMEPGDAYIVDSLGWAYYLSGLLKKSIFFLEKAVSLLPNDATLNDHLGDAYWKIGRRSEAISQWERVLIFKPDFKKKEIVKEKINKGL